MTGGRLKRVKKYVEDEDCFALHMEMGYNVNITNLIKYYKKHNKLATITAVQPLQIWSIKFI